MLLLSLLGCFTYGSMQRAETLGKGNREFAAEIGMVGAGGQGTVVAVPNPSFAARFGVSDRVDIGGRMGFSAIAFTTKVMLTEPGSDGVKLSLAPEIGAFPLFVAWLGHLQMPLLIGIPMGGNNEMILGPRAHGYAIGTTADGTAGFVMVGTSVGFAFDLGGLTLLPELTLEYPTFAGTSVGNVSTADNLLGSNTLLFNFQVGLLFGQTPEDYE